MSGGYYPLSHVFLALHKQVIKKSDYFWQKLEGSAHDNGFPPTSIFVEEGGSTKWGGPCFDAVTSGIALNVLLNMVLKEGQLFAKNSENDLVAIPQSDLLFLEVDPPEAPIAIRQPSKAQMQISGAYSFYEFGPEQRSFAFLEISNWSIRNNPSLGDCQSPADEELVRLNWAKFRDFSGAELYYRSSTSFKESKPITPSQIAQKHRVTIETIAMGKIPRSNSLLYGRYVEEVALMIATMKQEPLESARRMPEIKLPLLANLNVIRSYPVDKTNRGLRTLRKRLVAFYRSKELN